MQSRAGARGRVFASGVFLWVLSACSPTLDWRDTRLGVPASAAGVSLPASTLQAQFPCRPEKVERLATLDGQPTPSQMQVCKAGELTWAVSRFVLTDPSRMRLAQQSLRQALAENARAVAAVPDQAFAAPGMTPSPDAMRAQFAGRQADGAALQIDSAVVARGAEVVQISVMSAVAAPAWRDAEPARDQFLASLRW